MLAAKLPMEHLDENGDWLSTNPFYALEDVYTGEIQLPKFRALDQIVKQARKWVQLGIGFNITLE